jgi:hypothetical protein
MKKKFEASGGQHSLASSRVYHFLLSVDYDLAEKVREAGCLWCGGKLHRAKYKRKPRGAFAEEEQKGVHRYSLCCDQDGCRKRHTPPSVRFLGRRVYWGVVVVLVSAVHHGLSAQRMRVLREALGIDPRTLERWRQWWLETFVESPFWKIARAWFMPPIGEESLPLSLARAFHVADPGRLIRLLQFLLPLTTHSIPLDQLG